MLIKKPAEFCESEITTPDIYRGRRQFIQSVGAGLASASGLLFPGSAGAALDVSGYSKSPLSTTGEELTPYESITSYNNFYEFGTGKEDPARNSGSLITDPWSVVVEGECEKPGTYALEDLIDEKALEERVYRLRCVEAWSMVIPWLGVPLVSVVKRMQPTSKAKYVEFTTLLDPVQMPGQRRRVLDWPYVEGLRIDEAVHPLTLLTVGLYGKTLPNQSGAPIRLVVPWKYGYKSIKSIVKIRFTEVQPKTAWNEQAPNEYGFFSNVNPERSHPRWSQAKERRIGDLFKRETLPFNGYAEQVSSLYDGMDLIKFH